MSLLAYENILTMKKNKSTVVISASQQLPQNIYKFNKILNRKLIITYKFMTTPGNLPFLGYNFAKYLLLNTINNYILPHRLYN